jgi:hypothetical protein
MLLPKLKQQIKAFREKSRCDEARILYPAFLEIVGNADGMVWMPSFEEFWSSRDIVESLGAEGFHNSLTLDKLLTVRAAFTTLATRQKLHKQRHLVHELLQIPRPTAPDVTIDYTTILDSGYAFFRCRCRRGLIRAAEYLEQHGELENCQASHWSLSSNGQLSSHAVALAARAVLTRLNLDPNTSFLEIMAMGPRFACSYSQCGQHVACGTDFASLVSLFVFYNRLWRLLM